MVAARRMIEASRTPALTVNLVYNLRAPEMRIDPSSLRAHLALDIPPPRQPSWIEAEHASVRIRVHGVDARGPAALERWSLTAPGQTAGSQSRWLEEDKGATGVSWYQSAPTMSLALMEALGIEPSAGIIDIGGGSAPRSRPIPPGGIIPPRGIVSENGGLPHDIAWIHRREGRGPQAAPAD